MSAGILGPGTGDEKMFRATAFDLSFIEDLSALKRGAASMVVLQFAIDGSGTIGQHVAVSYGGVVASQANWSAFTEAWRKVLEHYELPHFKMAEAMSWYGPFAAKYSEWGERRDVRRDALLDELVRIVIKYEFKPAGMFSDVRLLAHEDDIRSKKVALFSAAVRVVIDALPKGHLLTIVSDIELDIEARVRAIVQSMCKATTAGPIVGVCFVDDRIFPAVQLADMIAWLLRERGERIIRRGDESLHPLLDKLKQDSGVGLTEHEFGGKL
jgi:hypothetical protein